MSMKERKARTQKWDVAGDFVEGILQKIEAVTYKDGVGARYHVLEKDGTICLMPGTTMINTLLLRSDIGKKILITYKGEDQDAKIAPGNSNRPKLFSVEVDDGAPVNVPANVAAANVNGLNIKDADCQDCYCARCDPF